MKPEFSKPFDLAQARAGAPIATRSGLGVEILKWDRNAPMPIIGILNDGPSNVVAWNIEGSNLMNESYHLVMTPLGYIDGKPVYVGDDVEYETFTGWGRATLTAEWRDFGKCRWPAPAKVYPETTMRHEDMFSIYSADLLGRGHTSVGAYSSGLAAVANAALRHEIDADRIVPIADVMEVARSIHKRDRTARDTAIAEAVRGAAYAQVMRCPSGDEGRAIRQLDLATIISTFK